MKIDHTHGLNQVNPYKKQIGQRSEISPTEKNGKRDVVDISEEALKLQGDNHILSERAEKIDTLKKQIDAGQYQVDHKAVAEKMVAFFRQMGGVE